MVNTAILANTDISAAGGALVIDNQITIANTTYTVTNNDVGKVLRFTSTANVTVTIPTLATGFNCLWRQVGAGQLTFVAGSGATLRSYGATTKSAGQYAEGVIAVDTSNEIYISGNMV